MNSQLQNAIDTLYPSQMVYKGPRAGFIGWNGLDSYVLKSGFQKSIRRGMFDEAIWYVNEFDLIHEVYFRDQERQSGLKAMSTNLINRLLITYIEDCGLGNAYGIVHISRFVDEYHKHRFHNSVKRRQVLYDMVKYLCDSQKCRELSHINTVYSQVYQFDGQRYHVDGDNAVHNFSVEDHKRKYPHIYSFDINSSFQHEYDRKKDSCFYFFLKSDNVDNMIEYVMSREQNSIKKEIMNILKKMYKQYDFKESALFARQIVLIGLRDININDNPPQLHNINTVEQAYIHNITQGCIQVREYILDKHTSQGRRNGKDLAVFASEGALVENECSDTNRDYKQIYIEFRQLHFDSTVQKSSIKAASSDTSQCEGMTKSGTRCKNKGKNLHEGLYYCNIHTPSDATNAQPVQQASSVQATTTPGNTLNYKVTHHIFLDNLKVLYSQPRGQLMCGKNKKQVFIPVEGRYKGYVVKGPWKANDVPRLNTMLNRMREAKKFNLPLLPFTVVTADDENGYTVYKNIASKDSSEWQCRDDNDKHITYPDCIGTTDGSVRIINRESMGIVQLSNMSDRDQMDIVFGEQFIFKSLVFLAIHRVGDVGMYNILVSNGSVFIIDYEENTSRDRFTEIDNLFAKKAKKYNLLLTIGVKNNREKVREMCDEFDREYGDNGEWQDIKKVILAI